MSAATRTQVLGLYRALLRQSSGFADYNLRSYALRKTRESFEAARTLSDPSALRAAYDRGIADLGMVRRQAVLSTMYSAEPLVLERP